MRMRFMASGKSCVAKGLEWEGREFDRKRMRCIESGKICEAKG
jgi:hypothetical protein